MKIVSSNINSHEFQAGRYSYRKLIDRYIDDRILCNNIAQVDSTVYDNLFDYNDFEYDENDDIIIPDIYQWYLIDIYNSDVKDLVAGGAIISYSDLLDTYVLAVDHYGTSWDYVSSNVKIPGDIIEEYRSRFTNV